MQQRDKNSIKGVINPPTGHDILPGKIATHRERDPHEARVPLKRWTRVPSKGWVSSIQGG